MSTPGMMREQIATLTARLREVEGQRYALAENVHELAREVFACAEATTLLKDGQTGVDPGEAVRLVKDLRTERDAQRANALEEAARIARESVTIFTGNSSNLSPDEAVKQASEYIAERILLHKRYALAAKGGE